MARKIYHDDLDYVFSPTLKKFARWFGIVVVIGSAVAAILLIWQSVLVV